MRIAIGSIYTECKEMGGVALDRNWFERYELLHGQELLSLHAGVVGGMLQVLLERGWTPVPLIWASTCPGGPLTEECYLGLKEELLARLRSALPVDGVLLPLHGAASFAAPGSAGSDLEGDLIREVRTLVGAEVPIVATLDLHAHVTSNMVEHADALLAWETYPQRDTFETGQRGARLLGDTLTERCKPTMAAAMVPVITSAANGSTEDDDTFAWLMCRAKELELRADVLSTSVILALPYLDQPQMGCGGIVVTDNDPLLAAELAGSLAQAYWERRFELEPTVWTAEEASEHSWRLASSGLDPSEGQVVLVEAADCGGGGAAGDSVATLTALLAAQKQGRDFESALVPVVDPEAAQACYDAGAGHALTV